MEKMMSAEKKVRCQFNGYCKTVLKREAINAHRDLDRKSMHEVLFSDLTEKEMQELEEIKGWYTFEEPEYYIRGKEITKKMLLDAIEKLSKEIREIIILYYFYNLSDLEIAERNNMPRSTVQHRRTSSFDLLKKILEANRDDYKSR